MMKSLVIAIVLAVPAIASADKNYMGGAGGTWDCSKDATVNINTGKGKFTFTGACKTININGGDNQITAGAVGTINITGGNNKIDTDELGSINIVGATNKVTYKKAAKGDKPGASIVGAGNTVTKGAGGSGGGKTDAEKKPPASDDDDDDAAKQASVVDCKKTPTWKTGDGGGNFKFVGACKKIDVNGGSNNLHIESVELLSIGGADNKVFVDTVGTIDVGGASNQITWKKALKGNAPTLKGQPKMNTIVQVK